LIAALAAGNHNLIVAPAPNISASHLAAGNHNLIDAPEPDISASVLTFTKYVAPPQKEAKTGVCQQSSHSVIGSMYLNK